MHTPVLAGRAPWTGGPTRHAPFLSGRRALRCPHVAAAFAYTRAPRLPPRVCQSPTPLTREHHDPGRTRSTFPCAARERKISKLVGHRCPLLRLSGAGHSSHSCKMSKMSERGVADPSDIGGGRMSSDETESGRGTGAEREGASTRKRHHHTSQLPHHTGKGGGGSRKLSWMRQVHDGRHAAHSLPPPQTPAGPPPLSRRKSVGGRPRRHDDGPPQPGTPRRRFRCCLAPTRAAPDVGSWSRPPATSSPPLHASHPRACPRPPFLTAPPPLTPPHRCVPTNPRQSG